MFWCPRSPVSSSLSFLDLFLLTDVSPDRESRFLTSYGWTQKISLTIFFIYFLQPCSFKAHVTFSWFRASVSLPPSTPSQFLPPPGPGGGLGLTLLPCCSLVLAYLRCFFRHIRKGLPVLTPFLLDNVTVPLEHAVFLYHLPYSLLFLILASFPTPSLAIL